MIRHDAAWVISRFTALVGIPRRTYLRWRAKARVGHPPIEAVAGTGGRGDRADCGEVRPGLPAAPRPLRRTLLVLRSGASRSACRGIA